MTTALVALLTAFVLDVLLGDPPNRFHPVVAMGSFTRWLTQRWNRGVPARRFLAGTVLILAGGALFSLPWLAAPPLLQALPDWAAGIVMGIFLKPVFAFRGLLIAGREVQQALLECNLPAARRLVAWHLVSRDTSQLSERQIASATIESLAENLTDSFLAPLLFFALGGLSLAWFYRFVNTADAMIGYRTAEYEHFGKFAACLDDLFNWIPARLAGMILVISAGLCRMKMASAWQVMTAQHSRSSSPNAGWTMTAAAGALGVALEKPGSYRLEGGSELPGAMDILRAVHLVAVSLAIGLIFCGGLIFGHDLLF